MYEIISVAEVRQTESYISMKMFIPILAVVTLALTVSAADPKAPAKAGSPAPLKIGALDATNYYDQTMIVTGKVVQVTIRPSVSFMNLDQPFPNSPFAIVVFHGKSSFYGDANALKGKSIEVRGKIKSFKDKPEIALDSLDQLTVVGYTNFFKDFTNSIGGSNAPAKPAKASHAAPATNSSPELL